MHLFGQNETGGAVMRGPCTRARVANDARMIELHGKINGFDDFLNTCGAEPGYGAACVGEMRTKSGCSEMSD
jgi:hypothetical protein